MPIRTRKTSRRDPFQFLHVVETPQIVEEPWTPYSTMPTQVYRSGAETIETGTDYLPWLKGGWVIMNAIGNALPADFGLAPWNYLYSGPADIQSRASALQRIQCLAVLGYTAAEIYEKMRGTAGENIPLSDIEDYINSPTSSVGRIYSGELDQGQAIQDCILTGIQYGRATVSAEEMEGGRAIVPYPDRYSTTPPVVITPNQPTQSPPSQTPRSTPPQGSKPNYPQLLKNLLLIWQRWQQWKNSKQQAGWNLNVVMPSMPGQTVVKPGPGAYPDTGGSDMAYINTSVLGGEGGASWTSLLGSALNTAAAIWGPNQALPGGATLNLASNGGGLTSMFDLPGVDLVSQGTGGACSALTSAFASGSSRGARAKTHVRADPITGRAVWFRPAGRPILWSSDLSACKRVRKVASRARRARGGR